MSDTAGDGYHLLGCSFLMLSLWAIDLILSGSKNSFKRPLRLGEININILQMHSF